MGTTTAAAPHDRHRRSALVLTLTLLSAATRATTAGGGGGRNWTFLNNSDVGTHWNPALKGAPPCQLRNASGPGFDCSSSLERCAEWCANTTACAAVSWNGPTSVMGKQGYIGCNFKCSSAQGAVWKGAVPGEGLAILIRDVNLCGAVRPPPPSPPAPPPPPPPPPAPPLPPRPPLGPPPPRRVRWYTNICCDRLWTHDIAPGGALDSAAATQHGGPIATGVYTSGWPPAFAYVRNATHPHLSSIEMGSLGPPTVRKRNGRLSSRFPLKQDVLPRQARDKHRCKTLWPFSRRGTAPRYLAGGKAATTALTPSTAGATI